MNLKYFDTVSEMIFNGDKAQKIDIHMIVNEH